MNRRSFVTALVAVAVVGVVTEDAGQAQADDEPRIRVGAGPCILSR